MLEPTDLPILKKTRDKISKPENWCQGHLWTGKNGSSSAALADAVSFCAVGALFVASDNFSCDDGFSRILAALGGQDQLTQFNDSHTHYEVLEFFDSKIAELENNGAPL